MSKKLKMGVGIGGPSIIMIFVVLCFTTLGALSLMTADADWKLTKKVAASVTDYYAADNKAEEILAAADAAIKAGKPLDTDVYVIPASSTQNLIMKLEQNGSNYIVLYRKLVPKSEWDYDKYKVEFNDKIKE